MSTFNVNLFFTTCYKVVGYLKLNRTNKQKSIACCGQYGAQQILANVFCGFVHLFLQPCQNITFMTLYLPLQTKAT